MRTDGNRTEGIISTGISGLDHILYGGLLKGSFFLIQGDPGSGKTTLAIQYLLASQQAGDIGLYVSLTESLQDIQRTCESHGWDCSKLNVIDLTQSRAKLEQKKEGTLFDQEDTIFSPSEVELAEITQAVIAEVDRLAPQHVVFDGLSEMRLLSADILRYRHQILALKHFFEARKISVLLLDDRSSPTPEVPSESLVGGNLLMERYLPDYGDMRRRLQITKLRGAPFRGGYHDYAIVQGGIEVYPRISIPTATMTSLGTGPREVFSSGIVNMDSMIGGGVESGTTTLLVGPSGLGKSTIAMQYAAAALKRGQKAAVYLFDEILPTFFERVEKLGVHGAREYAESGQLYAQQVNPAELSPNGFAQEVRRAVDAGARIVILDSLNGYLNAVSEERYLSMHLHELFTYLNLNGVATIAIVAQHGMIRMEQMQLDVSYLADTVLLFRNFEAQGHILKAFCVVKRRTGKHEQTLRQLSITAEGIQVGDPLSAFHGVMTGVPEYRGETNLTLQNKDTE